jgi:ComF family protein
MAIINSDDPLPVKPAAVRPERRLHQRLLDLVFPPRCVGEGCVRPGAWICERCWAKMPWLAPDRCIHCADPLATGKLCSRCLRASAVGIWPPVNVTGVVRFEGVARQAVHELKYTDHWNIATVLGPLMASFVNLPGATIIPVPLHWRRRRSRGFNQSELLAKQIGSTLSLPVVIGRLRRAVNTRDQVTLDVAQRRLNVAGAFIWTGPAVRGPVLLIDDVYTTGATLNACAAVARHMGAGDVEALVFASAQRVRSRPIA